jgi:alcohol-forming fatty acyl-CoA reductase
VEGSSRDSGATGLAARLAGRTVLVTGVTGFVGEALLQLMLSRTPDTRAVLLVRRRGSTSAEERIRSLLGKPIFSDLVERAGGVDRLLEDRLAVLEGDLAEPPPLPGHIDAVVHCAGDVSFDPPVDEGFRVNVAGPRALLERVREVGDHVHYVHVSTAYVSGRRRGTVAEGPVDHDVDLEAELAWGLAQRTVAESRSRSSEVLGRLRRRAEREHGRAGPISAAADTERRRRDWVREQLVELGTQRARSLGWTDCYTFTKALGERVAEAHAQHAPVTILRPSIIESALEQPYPGWIEGFKMAEPLILAYGRGELPEFPASPDTIVDIVPVDHVVGAILAVLAVPPPVAEPAYFHISSGARNPLTFGRLYECVRDYFDQHPFTVGDRGAARLPDWRFPGAASVERLLVASERAHKVADYLVARAPRADRTRELARRLDRQQRRLEFLRRYLDLYREYAEADLRFDDRNTRALYDGLDEQDRRDFCFDTGVVDWEHYLKDVHCPAVTAPIRRLDDARRGRKRAAPGLRTIDGDGGAGVAAFFDMDGTLLSSNVVETYLWLRLGELSPGERAGELGRIASRLPGLVRAERRDRSTFLRAMYKEYAGARLSDLEALADEVLVGHVLSRLAPAAVRRVREHRAAGHRTVLITGAIAPLTRPLAPLFDHIEAAELAVDDRGVCTGALAASPLTGESRAAWMRHWADDHGVDITASFGYADSHSDLPLLQAVGHPVAVSPDVSLFRHARRNHWPIADWKSPDAAPRTLNPVGGHR